MANIRVLIVLLTSICGLWAAAATWQDPQDVQPNSKSFMQAKMRHAKNIIEGLALENHETIIQSAQDLILLSNETAWNVYQSPEYLAMSAEFRSSADRLRGAARDKNVDGATLAFFEMTISCVRCHKYIRGKAN